MEKFLKENATALLIVGVIILGWLLFFRPKTVTSEVIVEEGDSGEGNSESTYRRGRYSNARAYPCALACMRQFKTSTAPFLTEWKARYMAAEKCIRTNC